ncbi:MAG: TIGR04282 family arsenosugar biosynthesis glycosyltransferase [Pirellulaceae bacterium]
MTTQLGMFAKHWQPGAVKTRLAASIGNEAAGSLQRHFVQTLLSRCQNIADHHVLCFTPANSADSFRQLDLGCWTLEPQVSGDLGSRMQEYFSVALATRDTPRNVLIGSDSPDLPLEYLAEAFDELRAFPVVLGPTVDGGYYLIGLSQAVPPIFDDIPWSTPEVWPQTIARLTAAGIPYHVLPQWYDVDDLAGLRRLHDSLPRNDALRARISSLLTPDS